MEDQEHEVKALRKLASIDVKWLDCTKCGYSFSYGPDTVKFPGACPNCEIELVERKL